MSYIDSKYIVSKSPLIRYANFKDGSHINLIRLIKPYSNGNAYAIHETTKSPFCSNEMYKTYEKALEKFNLMVKNAQLESKLIFEGITGNAEKL